MFGKKPRTEQAVRDDLTRMQAELQTVTNRRAEIEQITTEDYTQADRFGAEFGALSLKQNGIQHRITELESELQQFTSTRRRAELATAEGELLAAYQRQAAVMRVVAELIAAAELVSKNMGNITYDAFVQRAESRYNTLIGDIRTAGDLPVNELNTLQKTLSDRRPTPVKNVPSSELPQFRWKFARQFAEQHGLDFDQLRQWWGLGSYGYHED